MNYEINRTPKDALKKDSYENCTIDPDILAWNEKYDSRKIGFLEKTLNNISASFIKPVVSGLMSYLIMSGSFAYAETNSLHKPVDTNSIQAVEVKRGLKDIDFRKIKDYKEAIREVETIDEVWDFIARYYSPDFGGHSSWQSYHKNHSEAYRDGKFKGCCSDCSTIPAALLSDNGFPAYVMMMECYEDNYKDPTGHTLFLYKNKENGKYGVIGNTPLYEKNEDGKVVGYNKEFESVMDIVKELNKEYNLHAEYFYIADLNELYPNKEWIHGDTNDYWGFEDCSWFEPKEDEYWKWGCTAQPGKIPVED